MIDYFQLMLTVMKSEYEIEREGLELSRKLQYLILLLLSAVITVITVIVSINKTSGTVDSLFNSPVIVFIFAAYVAIQVICIVGMRGKLTVYRMGFYVLHIGMVVMLTGMFVYYISGDKLENVAVPVGEDTYSRISRDVLVLESSTSPDKVFVDLDFALGISDFKVEKYEDGTDKHYEAKLKFVKKGVENPIYKSLTVNHPVEENGWKIYLMNYLEENGQTTVFIMLKYNPGEYVTLAGIWMIIVGSLIMCFFGKRGAGNATDNN